MIEGVTTRKAVEADLPWLHALMDETVRAYAEETWGQWSREHAEASMAGDVAERLAMLLIRDRQSIGVLSLRDEADRLHLEKLYLAPPFQKAGIGTRLLLHLLNRARSTQRPMTLRVLKTNPAGRLYGRLGFVVTSTDAHYAYMEAR